MLDYALEQLADGISLPGILLILLPLTLVISAISGRNRYFLINSLALIAMSFPVTGKLLLVPIDIGIRYEPALQQIRSGEADVVVVVASGAHKDEMTTALMPSMASFSRVKRAEVLANKLELPLVLSGSDPDGRSELPFLVERIDLQREVYLTFGAAGTAEHAANIARQMVSANLKRAIVFVSGIHAYRTRAALQAHNISVPFVVVGLNDTDLGWRDFIPGFEGFFYWKHALKEYAGLAAYSWKGLI